MNACPQIHRLVRLDNMVLDVERRDQSKSRASHTTPILSWKVKIAEGLVGRESIDIIGK